MRVMKIFEINSLPNRRKRCTIQIIDNQFIIQGNYFYLVNKEFYKSVKEIDSCPVEDYMGLGLLRKRSPKKTLYFLVFAVILEFVNMLAGKLEDIFFFVNTEWTSYIVNTVAVMCVIVGVVAFFSKKKVIEISFLSKRICVDEKLFLEDDINRLHQLMIRLR